MSTIDFPQHTCPRCGTPICRGLTAGLCPKCLLAEAMAEERRAQDVHATDPAETMDAAPGARPRRVGVSLDSTNGPIQFGDYLLVEELARGGMGVVYRARHQKLGREVALKVILSGQFASQNDVRRFEMEAESAAALDHPGIVPIYEVGEHDGHHFFTMKLIEGGSLAKKLPELRSNLRAFVSILAQVADAIDYAHRRGILHRDIKPANILLDTDGRPIVTDLGLAKRTEADSDLTGTGAIVGTPCYMPPEQASASQEITTAADVFAIGAILYEGLTGRPPHLADSPIATLMLAAKGDVQLPSEINRKIDRILELICMKSLSSDPRQRYQSPGLLADDLRRWLAGDSVSVRPKSFVSIFGDLVSDQLRSVVGAMLIGIIGGMLTALPIYVNMATEVFGGEYSLIHLPELRQHLPHLRLDDPWWLNLPKWIGRIGFLIAVPCSLLLGLAIQTLVRPKGMRQAIAIGLVAGLLMTIVQFSMYGIAASWRTHQLINADRIDSLAKASLMPEPERQQAIERLYAEYPDLKDIEPMDRARLLGKVVSTQIMLASPRIFIGTLGICLAFSIIYCVAGTAHANQLFENRVRWFSILMRYIEVMILLSGLMITIVFMVMFTCGMVTNEKGALTLPKESYPILALWIVGTIPGWKMARWFIRWPIYIACVSLALLIFGAVARQLN